MGRTLLLIVMIVAAVVLAGSLIGLLMGALKWVLILGAILLGAMAVSKLLSSRNRRY